MNIKRQYFILAFIVIIAYYSHAQEKKLLQYSGNIGARYRTNISDLNYLPQNYASTYFNFNISAGLVGLNLNGELSTSERRFAPEFIKKLSLSPSIGCLHLDIGDHYPRYSKLVMSGAKVRGLSFLLNPGKFIFGLTGGRVRVGGADKDGAYRREAYGMQLGVKAKKFELVSQFSRFNDLPSKIDSIYTPQESITGGLSTKIVLPGNIRLQGEAGVSLHTRDKKSQKLDTTFNFQGVDLEDLGFTPRISSRADYAYKYNILIPIKFLQFIYQRDYMGPGFRTLGTPYLKNDILKDIFRANINLFRGKFFTTLMYLNQENNLNNEKTNQTVMDHYSITTRIRPVRFFSLRGRYSTLLREISDTLKALQYKKDAFTISPEFQIKIGSITNKISFSYGSNQSKYRDTQYETETIGIRYTSRLDRGLSFYADMNSSDYGRIKRNSYTLGATKNFPQKNASISAKIGLGDKTDSNISGHIMLPGDFRLNTSISFFRLSKYTLRYRINIVRNF